MPRILESTVAMAMLLAAIAVPASAVEYDLSPTAPADQCYQVEVEIKVGGDLTVRDLDAPATAKPVAAEPADAETAAKVKKLPMSADGRIAYEEAPLAPELTARHYSVAMATIKVDKTGKSPALPEGRRLMVVRHTPQGVRLSCPNGPLTREQLDLVDVIGGTPYLDLLLPGEKLAEGKAWGVSADAMGRLLGLDSVSLCEVSNVVDEATARYAKFQVAGVVHGRVEGAETEFDIRGIGLLDFSLGCVTRLNLAVQETRTLGPATPGFVGVAKINIKRTPITKPVFLTAEAIEKARRTPGVETLEMPSQELGYRISHDRGWFVASASGPQVAMRLVHDGALAAQATLTRLPAKKGVKPDLSAFEEDVRTSLGAALKEIVSSGQWTNQAGCECLGVIARSSVEDMELEHRNYLVRSPQDGSTVSMAVTLAVGDMAAVADADRKLVDLAQPLSANTAVAGKPSAQAAK